MKAGDRVYEIDQYYEGLDERINVVAADTSLLAGVVPVWRGYSIDMVPVDQISDVCEPKERFFADIADHFILHKVSGILPVIGLDYKHGKWLPDIILSKSYDDGTYGTITVPFQFLLRNEGESVYDAHRRAALVLKKIGKNRYTNLNKERAKVGRKAAKDCSAFFRSHLAPNGNSDTSTRRSS